MSKWQETERSISMSTMPKVVGLYWVVNQKENKNEAHILRSRREEALVWVKSTETFCDSGEVVAFRLQLLDRERKDLVSTAEIKFSGSLFIEKR